MIDIRDPSLKEFHSVLFLIILLCIIFFSLVSVIVSGLILNTFEMLEKNQMESRMVRFSGNLDNSVDYLGKTVTDYAVWDDMARYTEGRYPEFPTEGMSISSFMDLGIDIVGISNESGYIYLEDYSNPSGEEYPLRTDMNPYFDPDSPIFDEKNDSQVITSIVFNTGNVSGVLVSHQVQYHTSGKDGIGTVIMGRYFDPSYLQELSIILEHPVYLVNQSKGEQYFSSGGISSTNPDIAVQIVNESAVTSVLQIPDPVSNKNLYFDVTYPRNIYNEGVSTLSSFLLVIFGLMIVFFLVSFFGVRMYLRFADDSVKIAQQKDTSYQMIISEIEDGYFRANTDGIIEKISPSTLTMLGYSNSDEIIGRPLSDFYQNPDDRMVMRNKLFKDRFIKNLPLVLKRADGSLIFITTNLHLIFDDDGAVTGIEGIAHDNTAVLLAKKNAYDGESFYRLIFESANIGLFQSDSEGRLLLVNPVFALMFGYPGPEEMIQDQRTLIDIFTMDPAEYDKLKIDLKYHGGVRNMEISLKKPDGSPMWLNINVVVIKNFTDQTAVIFGTIIDITEKKKIETWLVESQKQLKSLFYFSPMAIFVYSHDGTLIDSNSAAISLFGTSEKSIPESEPFFFMNYLNNDQKTALSYGKVVKTEIILDYEKLREIYEIPTTQSGIGYLDLMVTPIPGSDSNLWLYLVQINDITERKKAEIARFVATERLKEAEIIAKLGHWEMDILKKNLFWSEEVYAIFEKQSQEFTPTFESFLDLIHPEDQNMVREEYNRHLNEKIPFDVICRIKFSENRVKYVRDMCNSEWDENGVALRSVGIIHDITSTRLNELALRESEQKYRQMFANVSLGLIIFEFTDDGIPGRIIDLNPKAQEMIQKTLLDILIGQNNIQHYLPICGSDYVRDLTYVDADICTFKSGIIRGGGEIVPVQVTLDIYRLEKTVVGLAIIEDITLKNRYEEERVRMIQQIERNLAELSILNDGIRNPLTIIMLMADELEKEISDPILNQIKNIDELIRQLDQRWIESDKILQYLQKHHHIRFKK